MWINGFRKTFNNWYFDDFFNENLLIEMESLPIEWKKNSQIVGKKYFFISSNHLHLIAQTSLTSRPIWIDINSWLHNDVIPKSCCWFVCKISFKRPVNLADVVELYAKTLIVQPLINPININIFAIEFIFAHVGFLNWIS